jgi:hypothetical protein
MRTRRRSTIIVVGGALAVASVGYGLGTQADDGTAVAVSGQTSGEESRNGPRPFFGGGQPAGLAGLADTLGVDASKLERALRDFHESEEGDRRDELGSSLADALGLPADKVSAALERLHKGHEDRFTPRLAEALNVDRDKLQAALDKLKEGRPRPPDEFAQALADELGIDAADVHRALFEKRRPHDRRHGHHALPLRQLASELGVTRAELRKAFRELRAGAEKGFREQDAALAKFLADRFDLSAGDVTKALEDLPRRPGPGDGGRLGPGHRGPGPAFGAPAMYPAPQPG